MEKLFNLNTKRVTRICGAEIMFLVNDEFLINGIIASLKNDALNIESDFYELRSLDELKDRITDKTPISLIINGKGVLTKKIPADQSSIPGINPLEFYTSIYSNSQTKFISICRKEIIDDLINNFSLNGFIVLDIYIGFSSVNTLLPLLENHDYTTLQTPAFILEVDGKEINNFSINKEYTIGHTSQNKILIGENAINPYLTLPLSGAIGTMAYFKSNLLSLKFEETTRNKENYLYNQNAKNFSAMFISLVFIGLLISFILFIYYQNKNEKLNDYLTILGHQNNKAGVLEAVAKNKQFFLAENGWNKKSKTSFYADKIASSICNDITLNKLEIFPIKRRDFLADLLSFQKDTILIYGNCNNPNDLNQFNINLQLLNVFKSVNIKNYLYNNNEDQGLFTIEIITK